MVAQPHVSHSRRMSLPPPITTSPPPSPTTNPFYARWTSAPMPGETEEQAALRVSMLQEAVRRSKEIDESLLETKKVLERRKKAAKILLLGQSESGKSSVLKNFQLAFSPHHFDSERATWRLIVQLNLINNIRAVIDILKSEWESASPTTLEASSAMRHFARVRLSLSPLFVIETNLMRMLAPETNNPTKDICVRAGSGWKALLQAQRNGQTTPIAVSQNDGAGPNSNGMIHMGGTAGLGGRRRSHTMLNGDGDPCSALNAQREDILWLWENQEVRDVLQARGIKLEETPGFFMNDAGRIASANYVPTDSDIIRARLRTIGVEEHHFTVEKRGEVGAEVFITDVGGSRSQRASWVPYFDDVQAILFLAPLAFNLTLEEDPRVNRLEDSLTLWREICANRLLAGANVILFFNKRDVLASTLSSGVQVKRYVPSYGDAPNDVAHVTKYFKDKFRSYHKRLSPAARPFMCYETSAIDIKSMTVLLIGVRESILRQHLKEGDMI